MKVSPKKLREKIRQLNGRVETLVALRECDRADKMKAEMTLETMKKDREHHRFESQTKALECLAHVAEAVSKVVLSQNRDM